MSGSSISSVLSSSTSIPEQLQKLKNSGTSMLLKSLDTSSSSTSSLTQLVCSARAEACTLSAISKSLSSIASAANKSGVSDLMGNVQLFALSMKNDGVDAASILKYLGDARELAESNPEKFREVFSNSDTASTTATTGA